MDRLQTKQIKKLWNSDIQGGGAYAVCVVQSMEPHIMRLCAKWDRNRRRTSELPGGGVGGGKVELVVSTYS